MITKLFRQTLRQGRKALLVAALLLPLTGHAQLSTNADKFLGNITTSYSVDWGNEPFYTLWNQITPENESKWASIQGYSRQYYNWGGCDNAYNYAKEHGFPFKFHCLIWGAQYPDWVNSLSTDEQYRAIEEWMDAVKERYPDLPLIDVVNEAITGHQPAPYKAALGGDGVTGYDWIIKAFEMAHERWPNAILIYNDYNTFRWQKKEFIDLVRVLRDAGAPTDAYGCQSHDLTDMELTEFKSAMTEIQNALKMPMYSTEYDIGTTDDNLQLQRYKEQIPYLWEADYCAGVTLLGYIYGHTWTTDGNSGLIRNGVDRPAMEWLRGYMQTTEAKTAKSPFPAMVKEASVYVGAATLKAEVGDVVPVTVRASFKTKTLDHVDLYVNGSLVKTSTEAPFVYDCSAEQLGRCDIKAVVVATDGTQYERYGGFDVLNRRIPYGGSRATLPGTLQMENFDTGVEGQTYHDTDSKDEGGTYYRSDNGGVDIVTGNGGYAIGYTAVGEWLEYSVHIEKAGTYTFKAYASSGTNGSGFSLGIVRNGLVETLCQVDVPQTANNNWDNYRMLEGTLSADLPAGDHVLRLTITAPYCNIDKVQFDCVYDGIEAAVADAQNTDGDTYNVYGMKVGPDYKGIVIKDGKKMLNRNKR